MYNKYYRKVFIIASMWLRLVTAFPNCEQYIGHLIPLNSVLNPHYGLHER